MNLATDYPDFHSSEPCNQCLPVALSFPISGDLDDQNEDAGEEQRRNPPHRLDQPENKPGEYQSYAEPPQHQGISFSL